MRKARTYNKVTNMKEMNNGSKIVHLNNVIYNIKGDRSTVVRNNKYITKDGNVRNFSTFNNN